MAPAQIPTPAKEALARYGWYSFRDSNLANDILSTASQLGEPVCSLGVPIVGVLKPQEREVARPNSTSALYGCDAFPPHTDMAHWPVPPRYLVMRASVVVPGLPTVLIDSHDLNLDAIALERWHRSSWIVSGVQKPYLCSIFFDYKGKSGFRWDNCTMSPYGKLATAVAPDIAAAIQDLFDSTPISMDWQSPEDILIIDNWRMVHMRPPIHESAKNRTLERVLVKETDVE